MTPRLLPLLLATAILLLGCSSENKTATPTQQPPSTLAEQQQALIPSEGTERFTHIITTDTEYYTDGPQQARPPDGTLKAGAKVRVIEDAGSYCRVETEDGVTGFVAVDAVGEVEDER